MAAPILTKPTLPRQSNARKHPRVTDVEREKALDRAALAKIQRELPVLLILIFAFCLFTSWIFGIDGATVFQAYKAFGSEFVEAEFGWRYYLKISFEVICLMGLLYIAPLEDWAQFCISNAVALSFIPSRPALLVVFSMLVSVLFCNEVIKLYARLCSGFTFLVSHLCNAAYMPWWILRESYIWFWSLYYIIRYGLEFLFILSTFTPLVRNYYTHKYSIKQRLQLRHAKKLKNAGGVEVKSIKEGEYGQQPVTDQGELASVVDIKNSMSHIRTSEQTGSPNGGKRKNKGKKK
jgi:hypothetical protein